MRHPSRFGERSWAVNNLNLALTDCVWQRKTFSLSSTRQPRSLIFRLCPPNAFSSRRQRRAIAYAEKCGNNKRYKHLSHEHQSTAILSRSLSPFAVLILFISFPDSRRSLLLLQFFSFCLRFSETPSIALLLSRSKGEGERRSERKREGGKRRPNNNIRSHSDGHRLYSQRDASRENVAHVQTADPSNDPTDYKVRRKIQIRRAFCSRREKR